MPKAGIGGAGPIYKHIAQVLTRRIGEGEYPPRSFLPSENQLAEEFQVTRTTIRKALDILREQHTVRSFQGKGYQVQPLMWEQSLLHFYSFGRDVARSLERASTAVLDLVNCPGLEGVKAFSGVELWKISRLRSVDGIPLIMETSFIPRLLLPVVQQEALKEHSLYDILEQRGIHILRAKEYLEAVLPNKQVQRHLEVSAYSPVFQITRYTYGLEDKLIEVRKSLIRSDRFRFFTELTL